MTPAAKRLTFWAIPVLALALVLAWLFRPVAVPVDTAAVERGPLTVSVIDEGQTRVHDVYVVSAPVPGRMRRIDLEVGDAVIADETVVARIEPSDPSFLDVRSAAEARAALAAAAAARTLAEAEVSRAQAERDFARADHERLRALAPSRSISASDLDASQRRARTADAALAAAQAARRVRESEYQVARARLMPPSSRRGAVPDCDCVSVRSPVSGQVLRIVTRSEGVVASGTPLVEVGDPRALEVVVDLLSADAVRVRPGQRVAIEAWGGDAPLAGVVQRVEPFGFTKVSALGIEEQRVNVVIDIATPRERWARLGHGYRVEPRIVLWEAADVLRVPVAALFRQGAAWAVFVERDGRAELREVEIGRSDDLLAEVRRGLRAGERVVVHPADRVAPGARLVERN